MGGQLFTRPRPHDCIHSFTKTPAIQGKIKERRDKGRRVRRERASGISIRVERDGEKKSQRKKNYKRTGSKFLIRARARNGDTLMTTTTALPRLLHQFHPQSGQAPSRRAMDDEKRGGKTQSWPPGEHRAGAMFGPRQRQCPFLLLRFLFVYLVPLKLQF